MPDKKVGAISQIIIKFLCGMIATIAITVITFHENKITSNREKITENHEEIQEKVNKQYKEITYQISDMKENVNDKFDKIMTRQSSSDKEFSNRLTGIEAKL